MMGPTSSHPPAQVGASSGGSRSHRSTNLPPPRPLPNSPLPPPPSLAGTGVMDPPRGQPTVIPSSYNASEMLKDAAIRNRSQSLGLAAKDMGRSSSLSGQRDSQGQNASIAPPNLPSSDTVRGASNSRSSSTSSKAVNSLAELGHSNSSAPDVSSSKDAVDPVMAPAAVSLGPSDTIRGRPRGFTVGAVPASSGLNSYGGPHRLSISSIKARPRSLLCNEITPGLDLAEARRVAPSSSQASRSLTASSSLPEKLVASTSGSSSGSSYGQQRPESATLSKDPNGGDSGVGLSGEGGSSRSGLGQGSSSNDGGEKRPSGNDRSRSGSSASLLQQVKLQPKSHASFVIAVVGHYQAGKSTVIKKGLRQFGLSKPHVLSEKVTSHSTVCVVDQEQRTIEVLEIDASVLLNGPGKRFAWPKFLPHIDAVILCYDAAQISSFRGMSELLENFAISDLSTVMLACKSEVHPKAVDPYYASDMASVYNVGLAECTVQSEEGKKRMRDCFSYLVKEVAKARSGRSKKAVASTVPNTQQARYHQYHESNSRASQEGSTSGSYRSGVDSGVDPDVDRGSSRGSFSSTRARGDSGASSYGEYPGGTNGVTSMDASLTRSSLDAATSPSHNASFNNFPPGLGTPSIDLRQTPRKMSNATVASAISDAPSYTGSQSEDDLALQESLAKARLGLQNARSAGGYVTIEELWDKLFHAAVSGTDDRFLVMFMIFYRGFSRPIDLLRQMIVRFETLTSGDAADGVMNRFALIRLTNMLADWVQDYPGDLSSPETYALLTTFYTRLLQHPLTTHTANQMRMAVESAAHATDVDAVWSKAVDSERPQSVAADVAPIVRSTADMSLESDPLKPSKPPSVTSATSSSVPSTQNIQAGISVEDFEAPSRTNSDPTAQLGHGGSESSLLPTFESHFTGRDRSVSDVTTSSNEGGSAAPIRPPLGTQTSSAIGSTITTASSIASSGATPGLGDSQHLSPLDRKTIVRNFSNQLLEVDDELIASELTRLEWLFFTAIRPRDLLRHILVPRDLRDGPVARSIAHFNYISSWVCSMILVQGKTKYRARMLEKFYNIASILRHDNNYGSLNSVLGGLSKTAVHRLKHTRELLKGKPVNKTYQSLVRLMSSERSNAAYRLALENSDGVTIPYVGVHLQDILSISDGNPSKRPDGLIHWRKFSLMDEAVMAIVRCQQYDRTTKLHPHVERLILDVPVFDDEALYQRSLLVEPRSTNTGTAIASSKIKDLKSFMLNSTS